MTRYFSLKKTQHFIFVFIIIFFIVYQYFYINQFSKFPWYHEFDNDSDPSYSAQTWAIVNGGKAMYLHHPGVTVYALDGFIYKVLSQVDSDYERLTDIKKISTEADGLATLNLATQTGRKIALVTVIVFLILIYFSIFLLTTDSILSFLITLYLSLSLAVIQYSGIIRPEVYSLVFLFLAGLTCLIYFKNIVRKNAINELAIFILTGMFFCFSLFSKIQIALYILFLFILVLIFLLSRFKSAFEENTGKRSLIASGLGLLNLILMPWWALKKPGFLTPDYLKSIEGNDFGRIYGPAPESFVPIVALALFGLFIISLLLFELRDYLKPRFRIYLSVITFVNTIITGAILAVYLVLLPVFHDFASYVDNTHHVVYALITNIFYAGFMENPHFLSIETLKNIFTLHSQNSKFLFFNPLYIVGLTTLIILVKLGLKNQNKKSEYLLALCFLVIAFIMDYFSTMRWTTLYNHYAVYSLPLYFIGVTIFIKSEFGSSDGFRHLGLRKRIIYLSIMAILLLNGCLQGFNLLNENKVDTETKETPDRQLSITQAIVKPFWEMIDSVVIVFQDSIGMPRMKSNNSPEPYKVLFSSEYDNLNWAGYKAFDKKKDWYGWHSMEGTTGYIGMDFGIANPRLFTKYSLTTTISYMDYMPKDFIMEASNDGNTWFILDQQTNQTDWKSLETRTYNFSNNSQYRFYRIRINSNNGAAHILICEISFE